MKIAVVVLEFSNEIFFGTSLEIFYDFTNDETEGERARKKHTHNCIGNNSDLLPTKQIFLRIAFFCRSLFHR